MLIPSFKLKKIKIDTKDYNVAKVKLPLTVYMTQELKMRFPSGIDQIECYRSGFRSALLNVVIGDHHRVYMAYTNGKDCRKELLDYIIADEMNGAPVWEL